MNIWRKKSTKWLLGGKRVPPRTPKAKRTIIESKRWYGTLLTSDGQRKQTPLTKDRDTSETVLRSCQHEKDTFRAAGGDRSARKRLRPLSGLVSDYESELRSRGNTDRHVTLTIRCIRLLIEATKAKTLSDMGAGRIGQTLSVWRSRKRKPMSQATTNHHARAIKGFSRWLWQSKRTNDHVLVSLRLVTVTHQKRKRRAMTQAELGSLLTATQASAKSECGLPALDRAMLYRVAAFTGLRAGELASLTPASFDLVAKTVSASAAYSKRQRNDVLPLHGSLVDRIGP